MNDMKILLALTASLVVSTTAVQAQSATEGSRSATEVAPTQQKAATAQPLKVESADKLQVAQPNDQKRAQVSMADIERGIADIEKKMAEGEGKADFPKEAYLKRLEYLNKLKAEQTTTPKSAQ